MQKQDDKKNRVLLLQQSQPTLLAGKPREWYEKLMKDEPKFERKEVPKQKISNSRMQKEQLKALKQLAAASSQGAYYTLGTLEKEETIHPEDIAEVLLECSKTIGDDAIDIFFHISGRLDVELRTSLLVACAENAREPMASMVIRKLDTLPSNIKRMVLKRLCEGYLDSMDSSSLETIETLIECGACEKRLVGMMARLLAREYRQEILAKTSERVFGSTGTTFAFGLLGVAIAVVTNLAMPKTLVAKLSAIVFMIIVVGASVIKFDITAGILALGMLIKAGFEYPLAWAKIALKTMTIHCRYILEYGGKIRENRKKDVSWANI